MDQAHPRNTRYSEDWSDCLDQQTDLIIYLCKKINAVHSVSVILETSQLTSTIYSK